MSPVYEGPQPRTFGGMGGTSVGGTAGAPEGFARKSDGG